MFLRYSYFFQNLSLDVLIKNNACIAAVSDSLLFSRNENERKSAILQSAFFFCHGDSKPSLLLELQWLNTPSNYWLPT